MEDENVFEVEKIICHREIAKSKMYYVKWVGFPDSENSWVLEENMGCDELVAQYAEDLKKKMENKPKNENLNRNILESISDDLLVLQILDGFRKEDYVYYKVKLDDGSIEYVKSEYLRKFYPNLLYQFLKPRLNTIYS